MPKTCRCLCESGLHTNDQVYIFKHSIAYVKMWWSHCTWVISVGQILLFPATKQTHFTPSFPHIYTYKGFPGGSMYVCAKHLFDAQAVKIVFCECITHQVNSQSVWQTHPESIKAVLSLSTATWHSYWNSWTSQWTPGSWPKPRHDVSERHCQVAEPSCN